MRDVHDVCVCAFVCVCEAAAIAEIKKLPPGSPAEIERERDEIILNYGTTSGMTGGMMCVRACVRVPVRLCVRARVWLHVPTCVHGGIICARLALITLAIRSCFALINTFWYVWHILLHTHAHGLHINRTA